MQEAQEDDYDGYEDADIPQMSQISSQKQKSRTGKSSAKTEKTSVPDIDDETAAQPEETERISHPSTRNPKSSQAEIEHGIKNIQHEISSTEIPEKKPYQYPPLKLLKRGDGKAQGILMRI